MYSNFSQPFNGITFSRSLLNFFSLFAIISFIYALETKNKVYWFLIPILFFIAFFVSKLSSIHNFSIYNQHSSLFVFKKRFIFFTLNYFWIYYIYNFIRFIFWLFHIDISQFLKQYFFYPRTIGAYRINEWELSFNKAISTLKFLHIILLPLIFIFLKIYSLKKLYKRK